MKASMEIVCAALACAALAGGCAVPKKGGFADVSRTVNDRSGMRVHWYQGGPEDAEVAASVATLLEKDLTVDAAVQIALLNNRNLQATYEELGVAQADLVQAGLLRNPVFFGSVRIPHGPPSAANTEFEIMQPFLDLLFLPARKRLASAAFERAKLRVADRVLELGAEVKEAYYTLQGGLQALEILRTAAESGRIVSDFSQRQREGGNINELELTARRAQFEEEKLAQARAELEAEADRERLTRLMGLWGAAAGWKIAASLPPMPEAEVELDRLETMAISARLDLAASRKETDRIEHALALARGTRLIPGLTVGGDTERSTDGQSATGPHLQLELPIFDQGQAEIGRLESDLRRSRMETEALAIEIRSQVREARARLLAAHRTADHFRKTLVPLRERIIGLTQQQYNFMLLGVFQLIQAKREQLEAYRGDVEAVRDYWIALARLEKVLGGRLPPRTATAQPASAPASPAEEPAHGHHHH